MQLVQIPGMAALSHERRCGTVLPDPSAARGGWHLDSWGCRGWGAYGRRPPTLPYGVLVGAVLHGGARRQVVATGGPGSCPEFWQKRTGASTCTTARRLWWGVVHTATYPTVALSQPSEEENEGGWPYNAVDMAGGGPG